MAIANSLLARLVRTTGGKLLGKATARLFPVVADAPKAKRSIGRAIAGAAITRIATRSVPGALVVGGGLLAKSLYDRRRARKAAPGKDDDAGV
jgi:hypothetical protein